MNSFSTENYNQLRQSAALFEGIISVFYQHPIHWYQKNIKPGALKEPCCIWISQQHSFLEVWWLIDYYDNIFQNEI